MKAERIGGEREGDFTNKFMGCSTSHPYSGVGLDAVEHTTCWV